MSYLDRERAKAVKEYVPSLLLLSLYQNAFLHALHHHGSRSGCLEAKLTDLAIFGRVVPAFELLDILKLQDNQPLCLPLSLYRLIGSASHQEGAAVLCQCGIHLFAILRIRLWIGYLFDINDEVSCHNCFPS